MVRIRSEINKTLNSLSPLSFYSTKELIACKDCWECKNPKVSHGRRGTRGDVGKKISRFVAVEPGPCGKQGNAGPPDPIREPGIKGVPGIRGSPGAKIDLKRSEKN